MQSFSFKIYPRPDVGYEARSSIDYQVVKSNIYQRFYPRGSRVSMAYWMVFAMIGVLMGISAFIVDLIVENLVFYKWQAT